VLARLATHTTYDLDDLDVMVTELMQLYGREVDLEPLYATRKPFILRDIERRKRMFYARERSEEAWLCDSLNSWGFIPQLYDNAVNL